jgi:hypothetical protein
LGLAGGGQAPGMGDRAADRRAGRMAPFSLLSRRPMGGPSARSFAERSPSLNAVLAVWWSSCRLESPMPS